MTAENLKVGFPLWYLEACMELPAVVGAEMGFSRSGRGVESGVVSSWARGRDASGGRIGEGGTFWGVQGESHGQALLT